MVARADIQTLISVALLAWTAYRCVQLTRDVRRKPPPDLEPASVDRHLPLKGWPASLLVGVLWFGAALCGIPAVGIALMAILSPGGGQPH
jgi:hypothetical protein